MKHTFTITTIITLTLLATLSGCKKDYPSNKHSVGTVKDICGNTYNYVKIGEQYWMAENMRCNKYDTQSERAGASLFTSNKKTLDPCYVDATDPSYCKSSSYSSKLTDAQIKMLGYLYNYSAAVGLTADNETNINESSFDQNRQGICPNGWRVPNYEDWNTLKSFIESTSGDYTAAQRLKSASGWYGSDGDGTDDYGFTALPAGVFSFSEVCVAGYNTFFFDASYHNGYTSVAEFICEETGMYLGSVGKNVFLSVRCIKN